MFNPAKTAIDVLADINARINLEWLDDVASDYENDEITVYETYKLSQAFIRGLMACGVTNAHSLEQLDKSYRFWSLYGNATPAELVATAERLAHAHTLQNEV